MLGFVRTFVRQLRKKRFLYTPLIEVLIYKGAILRNLRTFQELEKEVAVAPVLKAAAYGHGLVEVAKMLDSERLPFLCVDSFFEALILRNENIRSPILLLGATPVENVLGCRLTGVSFGIIDIEALRELAEKARVPAALHLKVDTGMHRHGIQPHELDEALALIASNQSLHLEGVYSHLADADTPDSPHAATQITAWNDAVRRVRAKMPGVKFFHCAATPGSFYTKKIDANVMRLGIGLYGVNASLHELDLRPALLMRTRITSVRTVRAGESVGYNATFTATRDMRIATIPVGYAEGVDRRLSNKGELLVGDVACRIVGRVSMNITSLDVSDLANVRVGDEVTVISNNPSAPNSIETMARQCGTIPYELLVHIPAQLRRKVVE